MTIVDFEEIPIHSGSIRVTVANRNTYKSPNLITYEASFIPYHWLYDLILVLIVEGCTQEMREHLMHHHIIWN